MATYIVFLKNLDTGEEFTVPTNASENSHDMATMHVRKTYPANRFAIHTAYTTQELDNIIMNAQRWPGTASKVQKGTAQAPKMKVNKPMVADSIFAAGSMVTPKPMAKPAPAKPATPTINPAVAAMQQKAQALQAQQQTANAPQASGMSVIERLKMLKG